MNHSQQGPAAPASVAANPSPADRLVAAAMAVSCFIVLAGWLGLLGWGAGRLLTLW